MSIRRYFPIGFFLASIHQLFANWLQISLKYVHDNIFLRPISQIYRAVLFYRNDPNFHTPKSLLAYIKRTMYKRSNTPIAPFSSEDGPKSLHRIRKLSGSNNKDIMRFDSPARDKSCQRIEGLGTILTAMRHCRANFTIILQCSIFTPR